MKFSEIPGQEKIKNELISSFHNNKLPHSILFSGNDGYGSLALAYAFASYIQCENRNEKDKCGVCPSCKKTNKLIHPDIGFSFPVVSPEKNPLSSNESLNEWRFFFENSPFGDLNDWLKVLNKENKNSNINKKTIGEISDFFSNVAYEGNKKISIVWHAEMIGNEGNRLLKLIEEPPPYTMIILITDKIEKILKTIQSRCRIYRIPPISDEGIIEFMKVNNKIIDSQTEQLIKTADGDFNEFNKLLESDENDLFEIFLRWLNVSYLGNSEKISLISEDFFRMGKENLKKYFAYLLFFLEQVVLSYDIAIMYLKLNSSELDTLNKLKKLIDKQQTIKFIDIIEKNINKISQNANIKIMIFESSFQLHKIFKPNSI
ncbi:MAG: hypothetical protein R2771_11730 [Saprospiraceae bacterium]